MKNPVLLYLLFPLLIFTSCSNKLSEFSYYKNIPEINGTTQDKEPLYYIIKIDVGYNWGDKKTQAALVELTPVLGDELRHFLSTLLAEDFKPENEKKLKENLILSLNKKIKEYVKFKNIKGIKTLAITNLQIFEFQ